MRLDKNLKQYAAAEKMGLTQAKLSSYEGDKCVIPSNSLRDLSEGYGVSMDWLMTGLGNKYLSESAEVEVATLVEKADSTISEHVEWEEPPPDLAYDWEVDPWSVIRLKGLNERIIEARGEITVEDMAERVSVELSLYKAIELGSINPNREALKRIVAATNCDARWLACGAVEETSISEFAKKLKGDLDTIGGRVKAVRTEMKMKQAEFAEHVGIKHNQVTAIEINRVPPSVYILRKVVNSTDVTLNWLIEGRDEIKPIIEEPISKSLAVFLNSDDTMLVMNPSKDEVEYLKEISKKGKYIHPNTWRQILIDYRKARVGKG